MAQAYGNTNIQDNLNTLAKGTYTSKINKKIGGKLLEVTFTYPNVMTMIKMRKLLKRVVQLWEQAVVDPEGAYDRLMSLKSLSEWGKAKASAQRYIKSRLRKRWFISKPVSRTQYMELRKTFFENTLKLLDITMWWNREVVVAILWIADTIFTKYNDGMQRAFKDANNFAPSPTPPTSPRSWTA